MEDYDYQLTNRSEELKKLQPQLQIVLQALHLCGLDQLAPQVESIEAARLTVR